MGKKSKRVRNGGGGGGDNSTPPALRSPREAEVETEENLQFEDPFVDEIEEEKNLEEEVEEEENVEYKTLNPYHTTKEPLEMDPAAYKMHFAMRGEWPSLSFDFIRDTYGDGRTRFPHSLLAVVGTQADNPNNNSLQVWKLSDLGKIDKEDDEEDEDWDKEDGNNSDSDSDIEYDPVFEHSTVKHTGGINRVRSHQGIVATWSDVGAVNIYSMDVEALCSNHMQPPRFETSYKGHSTEGYAMDFSAKTGRLATGDNDGSIHAFDDASCQSAVKLYSSPNSVEDLQWSPTEGTVLAAAEAGGLLKIYDTRAPNKCMLEKRVSASEDVNAVTWSKLVTNLLATGCDDGQWAVWDLRKLSSGGDPLARFTSHTTPITSMEWHPTDESMLVVSDEVGSFIYDLSVEEEEGQQTEKSELPPQLLFVHSGSPQTKEVHWHPQVTSLLMSTAYDGFHAFIPSNL